MDVTTKSTAELVAESLEDAQKLLRKEADLLRIGIVESLMDRLKGAGLVAAAAILLLPGLLFIAVGLTLWLPWSAQISYLFSSAVLLGVAGIAIFVGIRKIKGGGKGSEAIDHVKEDARWAREQLRP